MGDQRGVGNTNSESGAGLAGQAGRIGQAVISGLGQGSALVPRQLPAPVRDFTGRENQVAALNDVRPNDTVVLSTVAVVDGTGGVGKTSLVTHWAGHRRT
ncbi:hypothetical protein ACFORH_11240 [Amycolatopsis roodepoortensis]|uniref:ATP-binding protein n=1 Tax=Amycolatopsis roodepoortensis TaxID=700274 RepID=A0ABR9LAN8_9PSEU|nr:hypothetical protein [Amycolatopsis roodepoortensis]MBE1577759.1 hypothetical protein [Amycolatopsis roodepoortensis]